MNACAKYAAEIFHSKPPKCSGETKKYQQNSHLETMMTFYRISKNPDLLVVLQEKSLASQSYISWTK